MITLILGGASSGKSEVAERVAMTLAGPVTYVATWLGDDPAMARRVASHRARRPDEWSTIEAGPDLAGVVTATGGTLLIDALGTWVAQAPGFAVDGAALCQALRDRRGDTVVVSDEVGLAVHPSSDAGRRFREAIGDLNRQVATVADRVWLVVAGRLLVTEPVAL